MSMEAVGAYLGTLREKQRYSREAVAQYIRDITGLGTNAVQVLRIEKGSTNTRADVLAAFNTFVKGSSTHLQELLTTQDSTGEDGKRRADLWLQLPEDVRARIATLGESDSPDQLRNIISEIRLLMQNDPDFLKVLGSFLTAYRVR